IRDDLVTGVQTCALPISFGLVSVPVRMFPATESKELRFHFLDKKDLTPIAYEKVRRDDRERVDPDEIVRGFEIEKGRYVPLEDRSEERRVGRDGGCSMRV